MYFNEDHDEDEMARKRETHESSSEEEEEVILLEKGGGKLQKENQKLKNLKLSKNEKLRNARRIKRKLPDKRSGRMKAMQLFERKVKGGLGIDWMTRTSMLLLCEAYLIIGDPQVGMAIYDQMIRKKYRATSGLMVGIFVPTLVFLMFFYAKNVSI
jgi:hypothetical protein